MKLIAESTSEDLRNRKWKMLDSKQFNDLIEMTHLDKETGKTYFSITRLGYEDAFGNPSILHQEIYEMEEK